MKFGFAARLSWVFALAVSLTAGLTGLYVYRSSHELLVRDATSALSASARTLDRRIDLLHQSIVKDLNLLANHPASRALLKKGQHESEQALATLFQLQMNNNPAYLQMRLISAQDYGLEKVRIDRDPSGLVQVSGDNLQEKGYFPYVSDTLTLPTNGVYLSPIVINHERGTHAALHQPTAIFATPVFDATNHAIGVFVINLDLNQAFATLAADLPPSFRVFLANQQGDFLIHPDPSQTFGFDRGQRILMQNEFPQSADLIDGKLFELAVQASTDRYAQEPLVTAFIRDSDKDLYGDNTLFLGVGQPLQDVLTKADALGNTIILIVSGFGLAGILLAVVLARHMTHPINALNNTVQRFSVHQDIGELPIQRQDELGQLARSFMALHNQIKQQFNELQRSHSELETLARHDELTNLPNRRLFLERLESALARAKRTGQPLALLFIDLDKFKDINDSFGHEAGDTVLKSVASRLSAHVRAVDTVARLGGDEFVVLLENLTDTDKVAEIADKLYRSMHEPLAYADQILHMSISVGVALYPQDGQTLDQLINKADQAMYRAKADPEQRIHFVNPPEFFI